MAYYPLSQITPNLYTDGTEYSTLDGVPYEGYYYKVSTGKIFTGKTPQDTPTLELFIQDINEPIAPGINNTLQNQFYLVEAAYPSSDPDPEIPPEYDKNVSNYGFYTSLLDEDLTTLLPYYVCTKPTKEDYSLGEFRRYFCKKRNQLIYIEIDKSQYDKLVNQNPQIYWQMYKPFFLTWQLTGDKQTVAKTNKNVVELKSKRERLPKLGDYLKHDYIKYYKE